MFKVPCNGFLLSWQFLVSYSRFFQCWRSASYMVKPKHILFCISGLRYKFQTVWPPRTITWISFYSACISAHPPPMAVSLPLWKAHDCLSPFKWQLYIFENLSLQQSRTEAFFCFKGIFISEALFHCETVMVFQREAVQPVDCNLLSTLSTCIGPIVWASDSNSEQVFTNGTDPIAQ